MEKHSQRFGDINGNKETWHGFLNFIDRISGKRKGAVSMVNHTPDRVFCQEDFLVCLSENRYCRKGWPILSSHAGS
jgi:hypothetical protein